MADETQIQLAQIRGSLDVIKGWGIGIAGIVTAVSLAGLGYMIHVGDKVGALDAKLEQLQSDQTAEILGQIESLQTKLDELNRQTDEPGGEPIDPLKEE